MSPTLSLPGRRTTLRAFLVAIAVSALMGILALLTGDFSELEVKVLVSSLTISAGTLCALCAAAVREARGHHPLAVPTVWAATLGTVTTLVGLWGEVDGEAYWKLAATFAVGAAVGSHGCLVGMARLAEPHRWVARAAFGAAAVLGGLLLVMLWGEVDGEGLFRLMGALAVAATGLTLAIPVLHRMDALEGGAAPPAPRGLHCPGCGAPLDSAPDGTPCPRCGARFRVERLPEPAAPPAPPE